MTTHSLSATGKNRKQTRKRNIAKAESYAAPLLGKEGRAVAQCASGVVLLAPNQQTQHNHMKTNTLPPSATSKNRKATSNFRNDHREG